MCMLGAAVGDVAGIKASYSAAPTLWTIAFPRKGLANGPLGITLPTTLARLGSTGVMLFRASARTRRG